MDFVALSVDCATRFVSTRVETTTDKSEEPTVTQVHKGNVVGEDVLVNGHGDDDTELGRQCLDELDEAVSHHSAIEL